VYFSFVVSDIIFAMLFLPKPAVDSRGPPGEPHGLPVVRGRQFDKQWLTSAGLSCHTVQNAMLSQVYIPAPCIRTTVCSRTASLQNPW
jgi:hypothetical protein